ncbi:MAG: ATP-binding protein [Candidatus Caenarcaniphilales bacterium]|nr:ATP-binding protein [Candidatus Caenarcaniphilales bacterium]
MLPPSSSNHKYNKELPLNIELDMDGVHRTNFNSPSSVSSSDDPNPVVSIQNGVVSVQEFSTPTLREKLRFRAYNNPIKTIFFEAPDKPLSQEKINKSLVKHFESINTPYKSRDEASLGLWYPSEFIEESNEDATNQSIRFMSHPEFWDLKIHSRFQETTKNHSPSDLLSAFFQGPSFADCGSAIQAVCYRTIEENVGTEKFNAYFRKPMTPFIISGVLYNPIASGDKDKYIFLHGMKPMDSGNPIFHLFETKFKNEKNINEKDIQPGDIVYIKGVDKYSFKHLEGDALGWNLICTSKNESGENLYLGFGPNQFDQPKTLKEVSKMLIDGYNKPQSMDTKRLIDSPRTDSDYSNIAKQLADDKRKYGDPIVGITNVLSLSAEKIKKYILDEDNSSARVWHKQKLSMDFPTEKNMEAINFIGEVASENKDSSFENYNTHNKTQEMLLTKSKLFAEAIIKGKDKFKKEPLALIMTGNAGIGKTRLSLAVAKSVASAGLKVLFVDAKTVGNIYDKLSKENGGALTEIEFKKLLNKWIGNSDLIIIDDINSQFSIANKFLKESIDYVLKNKKALMLSSNEAIDLINKLPDYISYDNPISDNFLMLDKLDIESQREAWWNVSRENNVSKFNDEDKIKALLESSANLPSGVVIQSDASDLSQLKNDLAGKYNIAENKIKIVSPPFIRGFNPSKQMEMDMISPDYSVECMQNYDYLLMNVSNESEVTQLLSILPKIHNTASKIILVTDDQSKLRSMLNNELNHSQFIADKKRLLDRFVNIFPENLLDL